MFLYIILKLGEGTYKDIIPIYLKKYADQLQSLLVAIVFDIVISLSILK